MTTRYTRDHEWVRMEGDIAVVGISRYAAEQLGDVVFVELPDVGRTVSAGADMAVVESAKTASDVYAPISGEVAEINAPLNAMEDEVREAALKQVDNDPEGAGWFVKLKPADKSELDALMDESAYADYVKGL